MGILLVYSVTDKSSFNSIEIWMKQIRQFAVENIPILILSNKADVKEKQVSEHQSRALSERHHVDLLMTSARDNINIDTAMVRLYHRIEKEKKAIAATTSLVHSIKLLGQKERKCSCWVITTIIYMFTRIVTLLQKVGNSHFTQKEGTNLPSFSSISLNLSTHSVQSFAGDRHTAWNVSQVLRLPCSSFSTRKTVHATWQVRVRVLLGSLANATQ